MKAKTLLFFIAAILCSYSMSAQLLWGPPKDVEKTYWKSLSKDEKKDLRGTFKEAKQYEKETDFDFYLPQPMPQPASAIIAGNGWHVDWHQTRENAGRMKANGKAKVVLGILDTGFPSYSGLEEYQYSGHTSKSYTGEAPIDGHSHSTHILGSLLFADDINYFGTVHPLAEEGLIEYVDYKVCTNGGGCSFSWIAQAIRDYTDFYKTELEPKGIRGAIAMSLGGSSGSSAVDAAINEAITAGIIIAASSGNNGQYNISYPAEHPDVLAIGAHDINGKVANFSNKGNATEDLFMVGAGVSIRSTCKGNSICVMSGTSMGQPIAFSTILAVASIRPDLSYEEIVNLVASNCEDLEDPGYDRESGHGSPKLTKILDAALGDDEPDEPTCNDKIKNGDEEGVDCGGSCPPCEDEEEDEFPERVTPVVIEGNFKAFWTEATSSVAAGPNSPYSIDFTTSTIIDATGKGMVTSQAIANEIKYADIQRRSGWITITRVVFRVKYKENTASIYDKLYNFMATEWGGNRGVGIAAPADFKTGGKTAAYFTDLLLDRKYNIEVTITEFTFEDDKGRKVTLPTDELIQWPRGSQPFSYDAIIHKGPSTDFPDVEPTNWAITANWGVPYVKDFSVPIVIGGGAVPKYEFTVDGQIEGVDSQGTYTTNVKSKSPRVRPTLDKIDATKPKGCKDCILERDREIYYEITFKQ